MAYGVTGSYNVLSIVDQTHLPKVVKDPMTNAVLGSVHEVKMSTVVSGKTQEYNVAVLYATVYTLPRPLFC